MTKKHFRPLQATLGHSQVLKHNHPTAALQHQHYLQLTNELGGIWWKQWRLSLNKVVHIDENNSSCFFFFFLTMIVLGLACTIIGQTNCNPRHSVTAWLVQTTTDLTRPLPGEEELHHVDQGVFSRLPEELCQHTTKHPSQQRLETKVHPGKG